LLLLCIASPLAYPLQLFCPQHPMVGHWLTVARNKLSPPLIFRGAVAELGRCLIYEASQSWLPTLAAEVETPQGMADCQYVDQSKPVHVGHPALQD